MTDLAGLLELLYLARTRWRTARLTVADWTHLDRQQDAYEHGLAAAGVRAGTSPAHDWGAIAALLAQIAAA